MKNILALVLLVGSIVMVGCSSEPGNDLKPAGKSANPTVAPANEAKAKAGIADATATPAPEGVKTGTPGG